MSLGRGGDGHVQPGLGWAVPPVPDTDAGEHQDRRAHFCALSHPKGLERDIWASSSSSSTQRHTFWGRLRWQMEVTAPVILSQVPGTESPFP